MEVILLEGKKEKKSYLKFVRSLYRGDANYVCTAEFTLEYVLFCKTNFIKSGEVLPIAVKEGNRLIAAAVCFYDKKSPYLAMGYFEAEQGRADAVELLVQKAKDYAEKYCCKSVAIGLNAHLSYGVGILKEGFSSKCSFDSLYNKPYYSEFFKGMKEYALSSYRCAFDDIKQQRLSSRGDVTLRFADMSAFSFECENMRLICDKTVGNTFLYTPTDRGHFFELIKDLKPFLKSENLIFAEKDGQILGFVFWHPDFNQMLKGGKTYSAMGIGGAYLFNRKRIDTAVINAIGSLNSAVTLALLSKVKELIKGRYDYIETTFIWDANTKSRMIAEKFFGKPNKRYGVYFTDDVD